MDKRAIIVHGTGGHPDHCWYRWLGARLAARDYVVEIPHYPGLNRDPIETFLVERYWPDVDLAQLQAAMPRLEAAVEVMAAGGRRVAHLGSILMPADQVVFSLFAADDESAVRELNERAELPADRIAKAIALIGDVIASNESR